MKLGRAFASSCATSVRLERNALVALDAGWPAILADDATATGSGVGPNLLASAHLAAPITQGARVLCVGLNFNSHASEVLADAPAYPNFFVRFPSSLVGPDEAIQRPSVSLAFDWEGEVAVVIGKGGHNIAPEKALDAVAGLTLFGDHSLRDFQMHGKQATAGKNFDRSGSIGPYVTTLDEVGPLANVEFKTLLNGEVVQHGTLAELIHDVPTIIAYASSFMTLMPGDIIALGTPPGIGARRIPPRWLVPGDTIEIVSEQLGRLTNAVRDHADANNQEQTDAGRITASAG